MKASVSILGTPGGLGPGSCGFREESDRTMNKEERKFQREKRFVST